MSKESRFLPADDWLSAELGDGPDWLLAERKAAAEAAHSAGVPSRRVEEWKYTDLRKFSLAEGAAPHADDPFAAIGVDRDVKAAPLEDAAVFAPFDHPLDALNRAQARTGFLLDATSNETVRLHFGAGHTRSLIRVAPGVNLTVIEAHDSSGLADHVVAVDLGEGATLTQIRGRVNGGNQIFRQHTTLNAKARHELFAVTSGGAQTRHELHTDLAGEGAELALFGAYLLSAEQHLDTTTVTRHLVPNARSEQTFKGVLGGRAQGVYQGKVAIAKGADGSEAHQLSKAVLLSPRAEIDHKPELEIYADEVIASHGATSGALDEAALFYLRARGVPELDAKALLVAAFVDEVIEALPGNFAPYVDAARAHVAEAFVRVKEGSDG